MNSTTNPAPLSPAFRSTRDIAKRVAAALTMIFCGTSCAVPIKVEGAWYVLTTDTGEGVDFVYDAADFSDDDVEELEAIAVNEITRKAWDYSLWCSEGPQPITDRHVAVWVYLNEDRLIGEGGSCTPVLTDADTALLDIVTAVQP